MNQDHMKTLLLDMYRQSVAFFGKRNWWPAGSPFEVCVGAILTQNTAWSNVAKAIANLKEASALEPSAIYYSSHEQLATWIRPAGYYNVKAVRLRNFINYLVERHSGSLDSLFADNVQDLRTNLLSIKGIGKETADSMILYAAHKPIFVIDAYTGRVLKRHGTVPYSANYDVMQELFHENLPVDVELYNDFHAQFVALGHHYCKKVPLCYSCPLKSFLPNGNPILV